MDMEQSLIPEQRQGIQYGPQTGACRFCVLGLNDSSSVTPWRSDYFIQTQFLSFSFVFFYFLFLSLFLSLFLFLSLSSQGQSHEVLLLPQLDPTLPLKLQYQL